MTQDTHVIDIRLWLNRILKNWYWFVISCVIFGLLGLYKYFSATPQFTVNARIMIRSNNAEQQFAQMEIMQLMGISGMKQTTDEIAILTSRDIITEVVKDLNLQSVYYKKDGLRWMGQYPTHDLSVVYQEMFLDTTKRGVRVRITARKNDYLVKVRYGNWRYSCHRVADLTTPFNTCAGDMSFALHKPLERGDRCLLWKSITI